jgi:hypothetical protein
MVTAILLSAFLAFLLGFVWYAPGVFGNAWTTAIGKKKDVVESTVAQHAISIVGWLSASFVYAWLASHLHHDVKDYLFLSIAVWGAFMLPPKAMAIMHGNFNTKLVWIDGGYQLAGYIILAVVFRMFT